MTPILAGPAQDERPHRDAALLPPELQGGDATKFAYTINNLQIQGGEQIQLANPGVTAIVGGNNAGKSTLLRQIREMSAIQPGMPQQLSPPHLLTGLGSSRSGSAADLAAWLLQHAHLGIGSNETQPSFRRYAVQPVMPNHLQHYWESGTQLGLLSAHLVHYADARNRHSWTNGVGRRDDSPTPRPTPSTASSSTRNASTSSPKSPNVPSGDPSPSTGSAVRSSFGWVRPLPKRPPSTGPPWRTRPS